ncbi:MAG: FAA hydrolase family protein [Chryseobacterium sp.]|nr:MAG: FAA hydrolase family protein [Chryseobacterium sp.]
MKIICIGRNYSEHAKELNNDIPDEPVIFLKPDTAVLKGNDFYLPEFSDDVHYELELTVRISKGGKYIMKENACKHYDEIGLGIDFTARDLQSKLKSKGLPWELAKGFDGSAALSNFVPKDELPDEIEFRLEKNGDIVQHGNSSQMIFGIDEMISYVSKYFTLRTGDVLFTGTPAGVGRCGENDLLEGFLGEEKLLSLKVR